MSEYNMQILICGGTGCKASESEEIRNAFTELLNEYGLEEEVQVVMTGCFGFCEKGPIVKMMPDNTFYVHVTPADTEEIIKEHIVKGRQVERLLYRDPVTKTVIHDSKHMDFYKKIGRASCRERV